MIRVNLVPAEILAKAQQKQKALQLGAACGILVLLVAVVSLGFVAKVKGLEKKLATQQAEFDRLSAIVAKVKEVENARNLLKARLEVIKNLDRGRRAYPYFMSDFVRSVPPGVRIRSLNTSGGGNAPMKLNMQAEARTNEDIALWVRKLEESGKFSGIEMGAVTTQGTAAEVLRGFSLTATYTPAL